MALRHASGFTLIEMVVSMALLTVVMGACVSITSLAARAMPGTSDATTSLLETRRWLMRVAEELATAVEITEAQGDQLTASVPDPDNDSRVYQVRLAQRGGPPVSLIRVGRSTTDVLAEDLASIDISYGADPGDATRIASATITLVPATDGSLPIRHTIVFLAKPVAP